MRGISPIISTILMVAIAIAAAVVVYYITMDVMTKQGAQLQEQASQGQTTVVIDTVDATTSSVNVYLRNLGEKDTNVTVYILEDGSVKCHGTGSVNAKSTNTVNVSCSLDTSKYYVAKVVTEGGSSYQYTFKPHT